METWPFPAGRHLQNRYNLLVPELRGVKSKCYNQNMITALGPVFHINYNLVKLSTSALSLCSVCVIIFV